MICARARTSLNPVWCGDIFVRPHAGTSPSRSTRSVPGVEPEIDRVEDQHAARGRHRLVEHEPERAAVLQRDTPRGKLYAACSASTARTPKPSSAHSRLPMPSTRTSQRSSTPPPVTAMVTGAGYVRSRKRVLRYVKTMSRESGQSGRPALTCGRSARESGAPPRACPTRPAGASRRRRRCRRTRPAARRCRA